MQAQLAQKDEDERSAIVQELAKDHKKSVETLASLGLKSLKTMLMTCRAMAAEAGAKSKAVKGGEKKQKGGVLTVLTSKSFPRAGVVQI